MKPTTPKVRVAHLVSHPIQYFAPLYQALAQRPEIELTVYFYSGLSFDDYFDHGFGRNVKWDSPISRGYKYFIDSQARGRKIAQGFDWRPSWSLLNDLFRNEYDIFWLHGYMFLNSWIVAALGRILGKPVLLREEQTLLTPRSAVKRVLKQLALPILFKNVYCLYLGTSNREYLESYGASNLFHVPYGVDNAYLAGRFDELSPNRVNIREQFGINNDHPVILFAGKLIDKKQPQLLLEAFRRIRRTTACNLLFVGTGPLCQSLEAAVQEHAIPDVHFAGFLNQSAVPLAYTAGDVFVLPSAYQETWGLVVNEAMNFNLPIIVSDRVGCAADLVEENRNGYVFKSGCVDELVSALRKLIDSAGLRKDFGGHSGQIVKRYSIDVIAQRLVEACLTTAVAKSASQALA